MQGSVRQRVKKKGAPWTAYWESTDPATGKRRQHSRGGHATKRDAEAYLSTVMAKVTAGVWTPTKKRTVEELLSDWLAAKETEGLRVNTMTMYRNVCAGWIVPHIGGTPVTQLSPAKGKELVDALRSEAGSHTGRGQLSPRSVQLAVQTLKAATKWAFECGDLPQDPLARFKRPRIQASSSATDAWTMEEVGKFLKSVADDRLVAAWWLFLARGPRRGEIAGLKWSNLDLEAGVMRVVETRVTVSAQAMVSGPKTKAGRRAIPLDADLVGLLRAHRARQAADRLAAGEAWKDTGYVFVDELGQPYRPEFLSRRFTALVKGAGLRMVRLHDTRHTAATLMLLQGWSPKVVAEILGHESTLITLDTYAHVQPGITREAGAGLTAALKDEVEGRSEARAQNPVDNPLTSGVSALSDQDGETANSLVKVGVGGAFATLSTLPSWTTEWAA